MFLQLSFDAIDVECNLFPEFVDCLVHLFRIDRFQCLLLQLTLNFFSEFDESTFEVYLKCRWSLDGGVLFGSERLHRVYSGNFFLGLAPHRLFTQAGIRGASSWAKVFVLDGV